MSKPARVLELEALIKLARSPAGRTLAGRALLAQHAMRPFCVACKGDQPACKTCATCGGTGHDESQVESTLRDLRVSARPNT